jgi:hypothetical protein
MKISHNEEAGWDKQVSWDVNDEQDVRKARGEYLDLSSDGRRIYYCDRQSGGLGPRMKDFDHRAEMFIAVVPPRHEFGQRPRMFVEPIFFGAGAKSGERARQLVDLVEDTMTLIAGQQQPDHPQSEGEARALKEERQLIDKDHETMLLDIITALGGKHLLRRRLRKG